MACSLSASRAEVGSSRMMIGAFLRKARAIANALAPATPERRSRARRPGCRSPHGKDSMKASALAMRRRFSLRRGWLRSGRGGCCWRYCRRTGWLPGRQGRSAGARVGLGNSPGRRRRPAQRCPDRVVEAGGTRLAEGRFCQRRWGRPGRIGLPGLDPGADLRAGGGFLPVAESDAAKLDLAAGPRQRLRA